MIHVSEANIGAETCVVGSYGKITAGAYMYHAWVASVNSARERGGGGLTGKQNKIEQIVASPRHSRLSAVLSGQVKRLFSFHAKKKQRRELSRNGLPMRAHVRQIRRNSTRRYYVFTLGAVNSSLLIFQVTHQVHVRWFRVRHHTNCILLVGTSTRACRLAWVTFFFCLRVQIKSHHSFKADRTNSFNSRLSLITYRTMCIGNEFSPSFLFVKTARRLPCFARPQTTPPLVTWKFRPCTTQNLTPPPIPACGPPCGPIIVTKLDISRQQIKVQ